MEDGRVSDGVCWRSEMEEEEVRRCQMCSPRLLSFSSPFPLGCAALSFLFAFFNFVFFEACSDESLCLTCLFFGSKHCVEV